MKHLRQQSEVGNMKISNYQSGQALITLLFFTVIAIAIISASVAILYANTQSTTTAQQGQTAYYNAETGVEDGELRVLRNPTMLPNTAQYYPITGSTSISVQINSNVIKSTGTSGSTTRIITVQATNNAGIITFSNWKESSN